MTYEEVCAEWVRRRFNAVGTVTNVNFDFREGDRYMTGCETCGWGSEDSGLDVSWRDDTGGNYRELGGWEFTGILKELVAISNEVKA